MGITIGAGDTYGVDGPDAENPNSVSINPAEEIAARRAEVFGEEIETEQVEDEASGDAAAMTGTLETSDPNNPEDANAVTPSEANPSIDKTEAGETPDGSTTEAYDPSEHSVDEVVAYLETADENEKERVLAAEAEGKARKGVLEA